MNREKLLELQIRKLELERKVLLSVVEQLPGHVYWLNTEGVYLGCNDCQARDFGLRRRSDVVGLTNSDLFSAEEAKELDAVNNRVVTTLKTYVDEETNFYGGEFRTYLTHKIPMLDLSGNVLGVLGISIDVTEKKRAEHLEFENSLQELRLKIGGEFGNFIRKAAHDLMSPLFILDNTVKVCTELSDRHARILSDVVRDIQGIVEHLSVKFKSEEKETYSSMEQSLLICLTLKDLLAKKRSEYRDRAVSFKYQFEPGLEFATIKCDPLSFGRVISNVVNNAVESLRCGVGNICVSLGGDDKEVCVSIKDDGCGMSPEMVRRIRSKIGVVTTKQSGNGLGLKQLFYTLEKYKGSLDVRSEENKGTEMILKFPRAPLPKYIADKLTINKGCTVLVLDDAKSMFSEWHEIFKQFGDDISVKYFVQGDDALRFIDDFEQKDKLVFLCDYYLRSQNRSGLTVILESGIKRNSLLVTSFYNDKKIFDCAEEIDIQVLPKQLIHVADISVV